MSGIKIGKNVIENLTTGMYEDSKIIYREYIQNSADQIDKAIRMGLYQDEEPYIDISIDVASRNVSITDNATGIEKTNVEKKLANVADSDKIKGVDKGFRGIGRLGGLAYCDTLKFITSYKGENTKTIMTWDAKECIRLITDSNIKYSAEEILSRIIKYDEEPCDVENHFFTVELINIRKENNELLDVDEINKYISSNAPVPYNNKFIFRSKIYEHLKNNGLLIDEYKIYVDDQDVLKNYSTLLYESSFNHKKKYDEINDIQFKEFRNSKKEVLAWMWFGISRFDKQIPAYTNEMRGIRLRKENIQIGDSYTLTKLFKEQRGNFYFVGEVHAVHRDLIPNARRDYFNENETRNEFEAELKYYFVDTLHNLYCDANKLKNALKREVNLLEKQTEYKSKLKKGFVDDKEKQKIESEIKVADHENEKAKKELDKLKTKSDGNEVFKKVIKLIEKKHVTTIGESNFVRGKELKKGDDKKPDIKPTYVVDELKKLSRGQRKLVSKIYGVINEILPPELSNNLINKIQNELNK